MVLVQLFRIVTVQMHLETQFLEHLTLADLLDITLLTEQATMYQYLPLTLLPLSTAQPAALEVWLEITLQPHQMQWLG